MPSDASPVEADRPPLHILVVEDDREISALISDLLRSRGIAVSTAGNGRQADRVLRAQHTDLVLLDIRLPGEDGIAICRRLRATPETSEIPIIVVSALGSEADRVRGLQIGADDYLVKPFSPQELLARIQAVLRRSDSAQRRAAASQGDLHFDGWCIDLRRQMLAGPDGARVFLTSTEFALLTILARAHQTVLSRDQLSIRLHGRNAAPWDRSIDVLVSRLRRKIEPDPQQPTLIRTVRNGGYLFTPEVHGAAHEAAHASPASF